MLRSKKGNVFGSGTVRHCEEPLCCSFCAKSQHNVRKLIRAPSAAAICDECVTLSATLLREDGTEKPQPAISLPSQADDMASILAAIRRCRSN